MEHLVYMEEAINAYNVLVGFPQVETLLGGTGLDSLGSVWDILTWSYEI